MSHVVHSPLQSASFPRLLVMWAAVVAATVVYCELSQVTQNRPLVELSVSLLWNAKVWPVWIAVSAALVTGRGRTAVAKLCNRPAWRLLLWLVLVVVALVFEWTTGALFESLGWLGQDDAVWTLIYRRLPLWVVALIILALFAPRLGSAAAPAMSPPGAGTLIATTSRGPVEIAIEDIEVLVAAENYVQLCLVDGRQYLYRATLTHLTETLTDAGLVRIHRSASVNARHVIERLPRRQLRLRSGRIVRVGRAFRGGQNPGSTSTAHASSGADTTTTAL